MAIRMRVTETLHVDMHMDRYVAATGNGGKAVQSQVLGQERNRF